MHAAYDNTLLVTWFHTLVHGYTSYTCTLLVQLQTRALSHIPAHEYDGTLEHMHW